LFCFLLVLIESILAEGARIASPFAIAGGDQIGDDPADILLLRGVIVGAGVIAGHCHRPGFVPVVEIAQEPRRVFHVAAGVEHLLRGPEILTMVVLVDLHAADVDELRARSARHIDLPQGVLLGGWKEGLPFDVQRVRVEGSLAPRLGQAHGIEYALGDTVFECGGLNLHLAGAVRRFCARGRRRQCDRCQRRQKKCFQRRFRPSH